METDEHPESQSPIVSQYLAEIQRQASNVSTSNESPPPTPLLPVPLFDLVPSIHNLSTIPVTTTQLPSTLHLSTHPLPPLICSLLIRIPPSFIKTTRSRKLLLLRNPTRRSRTQQSMIKVITPTSPRFITFYFMESEYLIPLAPTHLYPTH